jgi:hypothetical protein
MRQPPEEAHIYRSVRLYSKRTGGVIHRRGYQIFHYA